MRHHPRTRSLSLSVALLAAVILSLSGVATAQDGSAAAVTATAPGRSPLGWVGIDFGPYIGIGGGAEVLLDLGFGHTRGNLLVAGRVKLGATIPFDLVLARGSFDIGVVKDTAGARPFAALQLGGGATLMAPWFSAIGALIGGDSSPGPLAGHFVVGGSFGVLSRADDRGRRFRFAVEPRFRGTVSSWAGAPTFDPGAELGLCLGGTF